MDAKPTSIAAPKFGGSNVKCVRCSKTVYFVEQAVGPGGLYHKTCLCCRNCSKALDSSSLMEHSGDAYCRTCVNKLFAPKYTATLLPAEPETTLAKTLSGSIVFASDKPPSTAKLGVSEKSCARCLKTVYFVEQTVGPKGSIYHKKCLNCKTCAKVLDSVSLTEHEGEAYCKNCHKNFAPVYSVSLLPADPQQRTPTIKKKGLLGEVQPLSRKNTGGSYVVAQINPSKFGGSANSCVRCLKSIFFVEQVIGPGGFFHKACLSCKSCAKVLVSSAVLENQGEVYCKTCHKNFAPIYSVTLLPATAKDAVEILKTDEPATSSVNASKYGGSASKCTKCSKTIFAVEQTIGPGAKFFHKTCLSCKTCSKVLGSADVLEHQGEPYCRTCHKGFAPVYSITQLPSTAQESVVENLGADEPVKSVNTSKFGGSTNKCTKCSKSIFAVEQTIGPGAAFYHLKCLTCKVIKSFNI